MRIVLITTAIIFISNILISQTIAAWDFGEGTPAAPGDQTSSGATTLGTGISTASLTRGGGVFPQVLSGTINSTQWATGATESAAITGNDFYEFSVNMQPTYKATFSSITLSLSRSTPSDRGPATLSLRSSVNSYSTNLDTEQFPGNNSDPTGVITFTIASGHSNLNGNVTFRVYGYDAQTIGANMAIGPVVGNDVTIFGTTVLPIELLTFTANPIPAGIALAWSTASEVNNAYVAVERSTDGSRYDEITRVPGEGDSFEKRAYNYTDEAPVKGINYYRLRQVDFDGTETYSPVVQSQFGQAGKLRVYPSPATDLLQVTLEEPSEESVRWEVYDATGRLMLSGTQESDIQSFPIELVSIPEGLYTLQVFLGREVMVNKFVKK